jgi:hypothetical protein
MRERTKTILRLLISALLIGFTIIVALQAYWFFFGKSIPVAFSTGVSTFDLLFSQLDPGQIAFAVPKEMGYGETKQATLLLSKTKTIQELEQSLEESDLVRGHTIKVADIMEAHLSGNEFEILAVSPEVQPISGRETTEWKWDIKPKDFGSLPLHLSVNAKLMLDGQERTRAIRTFDETVYVHVTWPRSAIIFVRNNWQWLWTTLLVPVAGWLWHRKWKRKKKRK